MSCDRALLLVLVAFACTKSNPSFDANDTGGTADDDDGKDEGSTSADDASNGEADDEAGSEGGTTRADETSLGDAESSEGPVECAEMTEFDWGVAVFEGGARLEIPCEMPYVLEGIVMASEEGFVAIAPCDGCNCAEAAVPTEFHAADVLVPIFPEGSCARVEIQWSELEMCRPVGLTALSDVDAGSLYPVLLAGQDVKKLPFAVGGAEIGFDTTMHCACDGCCADTGIATLGFVGVQIPELGNADVPDLLGDNVSWHVDVFEAHVHDDCTPALSWRAIVNDF